MAQSGLSLPPLPAVILYALCSLKEESTARPK